MSKPDWLNCTKLDISADRFLRLGEDESFIAAIRVRNPGYVPIEIKCYCLFSGNPDQGTVELKDLKTKIMSLVNHTCPPWPG